MSAPSDRAARPNTGRRRLFGAPTRVAAPVAALVIAQLALFPGQAHAATAVTASGSQLLVNAQAGKSNRISVSLVNATFTVTDTGDTLTPGVGCTAVDANTVQCSAAGIGLITVNAGDGDDSVLSQAPFRTVVNAGPGDDRIGTGIADDRLDGGDGNDNLSGGIGPDTLLGRAGNDNLLGGTDRDTLDGGTGTDRIAGNEGLDIVTYASHSVAVSVDPDDVADDGAPGEGDNVLSDIEEIIGGPGGDTLTGTGGQNRIVGGDGSDTINGLGGIDNIFGGNGADTMSGGDGNDNLDGQAGGDTFLGGAGDDEAFYTDRSVRVTVDLDGVADDGESGEGDNVGTDMEDISSGAGNDTLIGNAASNRIDGGPGIDTVLGLAGNDDLFGGDDNDKLDGGLDDDTLSGNNGDDTLAGGLGHDLLFGNSGRDFLSGSTGTFGGGNDGPDSLFGGFDADTAEYLDHGGLAVTVDLDGVADDGAPGEGDNVDDDIENINGSLAGDTLIGNDQDNVLSGGPGDDTLIGLGGNDTLGCGQGTNDLGSGGAGIDTADGCESVVLVP
jgi:Ca2+-binding RTX toxin-like protein